MEKTELLAFRAEPQLASLLRQTAVKHDLPQSWIIRKAIEKFLSQEIKSAVQSVEAGHGAFVSTTN